MYILLNMTCFYERRIVISIRRFGRTSRFHLQRKGSPWIRISWLLKMGPRSPETSVRSYHSTLRNNPEERRVCIAAEAWRRVQRPSFDVTLMFRLQCKIQVCCDFTSCKMVNITFLSEKRTAFIFVVKQTRNIVLCEVVCYWEKQLSPQFVCTVRCATHTWASLIVWETSAKPAHPSWTEYYV
jgi:hypothetical protein